MGLCFNAHCISVCENKGPDIERGRKPFGKTSLEQDTRHYDISMFIKIIYEGVLSGYKAVRLEVLVEQPLLLHTGRVFCLSTGPRAAHGELLCGRCYSPV